MFDFLPFDRVVEAAYGIAPSEASASHRFEPMKPPAAVTRKYGIPPGTKAQCSPSLTKLQYM
jgi:hypothetical protein